MVPWTLPKPSPERFPKKVPLFPSPGEAIGAPMDPNGIPKWHQNILKCIMDDLREPSGRGPRKSCKKKRLLHPLDPKNVTKPSEGIPKSLCRQIATKSQKGLQNDSKLAPLGTHGLQNAPKRSPKTCWKTT